MRVFQNLPFLAQDARGTIQQLFAHDAGDIKSILLISSKTGTVRSNHYHKKDSHYCYLLSGKAVWVEVPVGEYEEYKKSIKMSFSCTKVLYPGNMIFTPPMVIHAVRFLEDSQLLALSTELRDQEHYEDDTVRVELIQP